MSKRNLQPIKCQLCGETHPSNGIQTHLKWKHGGMTTAQYIEKFGDFRTNTKKSEELKVGKVLYQCKICNDEKTYTTTALSFHVIKQHKLSKEDYILKYLLNGAKTICKCGCGKETNVLSYSEPYSREYMAGHNSIGETNPNYKKSSTISTREKMRLRALSRIKDFDGTLPMHSVEAVKKRGENQTSKFISKIQIENNISVLLRENEGTEVYFKLKCNKCDHNFEQFHQCYFECPMCYPKCRSRIENDIITHFVNLNKSLNIVHNSRSIIPGNLELDIYFPDYKIAIEIDGLYWHGELQGKDKKYHLNKTIECEKLGIQLIHIFEDEWELNRSMVLNKIGQKIGVFFGHKYQARKCKIKQLSFDDCKIFLELNHLQGGDISPIRFGLFNNNELISVMTFSKPNISRGKKISEDGEYELSRFASKENTLCIGAGGKLLQHFIKNHSPKKIISYADKRWSSSVSNVYLKLGFEFIHSSEPGYWYFKPSERLRYHRFNFTKASLVKSGADPLKTEWQIMQESGYDRIWDCGHLKYEMLLK